MSSSGSDVPLGAGRASSVRGFLAPGFEGIAEEFERNLLERGDGGAAFAAVVDGVPVVDVWGGVKRGDTGDPWERDTLVGIFSGTKGFVATCLLQLVQRGKLNLEQPLCAYWPEFGANGKRDVLVRHVVSHRAGLPGLSTPVSSREATDPSRMAELLALQRPISPPGTRFHYHALTFGWLCGELIRRIDGRSVGRYFREEVADPLGLDAWIGLPAEQERRVATFRRGPGFGTGRADPPDDPALARIAWSIWHNPPRFSEDPLPANTRLWRAAEVPASNGIATARSVARLYGCLACGGEIDGIRVLSPEALAVGRTCLTRDVEPFLNEPMAFGTGFELQADGPRFGPVSAAFGHTGTGGSVHGAWPEFRTGFSYVTNTLHHSGGVDPRALALLRVLHDCLGRQP